MTIAQNMFVFRCSLADREGDVTTLLQLPIPDREVSMDYSSSVDVFHLAHLSICRILFFTLDAKSAMVQDVHDLPQNLVN